jgi:hypothetical protein
LRASEFRYKTIRKRVGRRVPRRTARYAAKVTSKEVAMGRLLTTSVDAANAGDPAPRIAAGTSADLKSTATGSARITGARADFTHDDATGVLLRGEGTKAAEHATIRKGRRSFIVKCEVGSWSLCVVLEEDLLLLLKICVIIISHSLIISNSKSKISSSFRILCGQPARPHGAYIGLSTHDGGVRGSLFS